MNACVHSVDVTQAVLEVYCTCTSTVKGRAKGHYGESARAGQLWSKVLHGGSVASHTYTVGRSLDTLLYINQDAVVIIIMAQWWQVKLGIITLGRAFDSFV